MDSAQSQQQKNSPQQTGSSKGNGLALKPPAQLFAPEDEHSDELLGGLSAKTIDPFPANAGAPVQRKLDYITAADVNIQYTGENSHLEVFSLLKTKLNDATFYADWGTRTDLLTALQGLIIQDAVVSFRGAVDKTSAQLAPLKAATIEVATKRRGAISSSVALDDLVKVKRDNGVRADGSQMPHAELNYAFSGAGEANDRFNVDEWTNGRGHAALIATAIPYFRPKLTQLVNDWNGTDAPYDYMVDKFVLSDTTIGTIMGKMRDQSLADHESVNLRSGFDTTNAAHRALVMHLIQGAIMTGIRTVEESVLNTSDFTLANVDYAVDWNDILRIARTRVVRAGLTAGTAVPATAQEAAMDALLYTELTGAQGSAFFAALHDENVLTNNHGNWRIVKNHHAIAKFQTGTPDNVQKAYNHMRFIAWSEWKMLRQMLA